ncbi:MULTISPECIES: HAD-IIIA family hydrolase [unclassified Acidovorax]|jgi:D-glycero-D-manno-heptose 1,7-bisphosphate phosphatase|uniref:D-glycero-alpha-D-manno-heptose-1,7-bisphosphate 7-phosphatase n=1 Tax=unclassified Acidovorax TaxID=2684926 RepID=UPI000BD4191F|nr:MULTISPECIES: HAD-IIIA family hydrolase [unclassified Acidovorax]OZA54267.1 MAG: histidinol phosphate phosphatase [Acidovorax sp. 17-64-282]HQS20141.1 HAD-IIIA family hydrolase [Acidovorax defluvii]OYY27710.1 MAG: histidinol phosphate phosphatase [Acidovorax sp. 35-64-16]OYY84945.1 MAG: histidinol phosphate phosphatase [Acidovorax sp. 28-64-14]OYZ43093.1 MAG: histidinol phosphate phosphatase [Acidovorax sp. 16-64-162]
MKLAILDRDGTLNPLGDDFITSPEEWSAQPGALEAVARLNHAGWRVVVATNQPGLGRGLFDVVSLNAIHAKMLRQVAAVGGRIDAVFYCPHAPDEACHCRTPAPGLLEQICDRYGVEPFDARVVGSCAEHLQAGAALGAQVHLVCTGSAAHLQPGQPLPIEFPATTRAHASLAAFVEHLLPPASSTPVPQPAAAHQAAGGPDASHRPAADAPPLFS